MQPRQYSVSGVIFATIMMGVWMFAMAMWCLGMMAQILSVFGR